MIADEEAPARIREAEKIARRAIVLHSVVDCAFGADREEILDWLDENGLTDDLSPDERQFLDAAEPPEKAIINFSWHSERLVVLLWALGFIDMPAHDEQSGSIAAEFLPPDADVEMPQFLASARLRPEAELGNMAETIYRLHWEARDAGINRRPPRLPVDIEIIQERHHAINRVMGYEGLEWDDVTTDT